MRVKGILVILVILLLTSVNPDYRMSTIDNGDSSIDIELNLNAILSLEDHDPINISSDADFALQASNEEWDGDGSENDPYIISGYTISSTGLCINISNTQVYFRIVDCVMNSTAGFISLDTVRHGKFVNVNASTDVYAGISIDDSEDIQFISCTIQGHLRIYRTDYLRFSKCPMEVSVNLVDSDHSVFSESTLTHHFGMRNCVNASIVDCLFVGEWAGLHIEGSFAEYDHNISNNTINGKPVAFFYNITNEEIDCSEYGLVLVGYCENVTFKDANLSQGWAKMVIYQGERISVTNCTFSDCLYAIYLEGSDSCVMINNTYTGAAYGVGVYHSTNCDIANNTFFGSGIGDAGKAIWAQSNSDNLAITYNRFMNYGDGIDMFGSINTTIYDNYFAENMKAIDASGTNISLCNNKIFHNIRGTTFYSANGGRIWDNYFGWNSYQCSDDDSVNMVWDDNISQGNYWSDYNGNGDYNITGSTGSVDRYPQMFIDDEPPTISLTQYPKLVEQGDSVLISAVITDNYGIDHVALWYDYLDEGNYTMSRQGLNWTYTINPKYPGTEIAYRIYACDWAGNWAVSDTFVYVVGSDISVTTTITTTHSDTGTSTITNTSPFIPTELSDILPTILIVSGILGVIVVAVILIRKR